MSVPRFLKDENHLFRRLQVPELIFAERAPYPSAYFEEDETEIPILEWLEGVREALLQKKDRIVRWFHPSYSLPYALLPDHPLAGCTMESWLQRILDQDENSLRRTLLKAAAPGAVDEQETERAIQDEEAMNEWLDRSILPGDACWMLLQILRDPKRAVAELAVFYTEIKMLSDALLGPWELTSTLSGEAVEALLEQNAEALRPLFPELNMAEQEGFYISQIPWDERRLGRHAVLGIKTPRLLRSLEEAEETKHRERSACCQILADPTRYKLCCLLARGETRQAGLSEALGVSQATVSHHLSQMRSMGIIEGTRGCGDLKPEWIQGLIRGLAEDLLSAADKPGSLS